MGKRKLGSEGTSWVENIIPHSVDDLAVQKKKVAEVEEWLQSCFKQKKKAPILLLTGPPGAGKTATVILLCKFLKAEVFSWSNSDTESIQNGNVDFSSFDTERKWVKRENQVSQFSSFLLRCNKYSLFTEDRKVILVEEFPNAFLRDPSLFHEILRKYSRNGRHPLIFIISDNTKGESIETRLFPSDLKYAVRVTNISFNPITQAKLMKAITKINDTVQFESCYKKLSKSQLEEIATNSMGDIRNAINSLQFLSISCFKRPQPIIKGKSTKESLSVKGKSVKEKSEENQRDSSLFLFHALGKILYCKRDSSAKGDKDVLPAHLNHLEKDPPLANAEDVFERTSLSSDAFSLFLHENFLAFMSDINVAADSLHWFSESDVYSSCWSGRESLSDYSASLASRGLMFNMVSTTGNSWRPLHKPHYYDCLKKQASMMGTLKRTFQDKTVSFKVLQTEFLPFMQKLNCKHLRPDQSSIVSEIGEMKVKRLFRPEYQALKEKEVPNLELDDFEEVSNSCTDKNDTVNLQEVSDEEIVIEEYDF